MPSLIDLTGHRFGRLVVVWRIHNISPGRTRWSCVCDCGNLAEVCTKELRNRQSMSCGCLRAEVTGRSNRSHGMSKSPTYTCWRNMHSRCSDQKSKDFSRYGGRGIEVCKSWATFAAFLADMGEAPAGLTIDRIDSDGNYQPGNCRWVPREMQASNKSRFRTNGVRVGISWMRRERKWRVRIGSPCGTRVLVGEFRRYEDAVMALDMRDGTKGSSSWPA